MRKLLFGARPEPGTQQGATALEARIGRRLAAMRVYYSWDSPFPDADVNWFNANGYTLLLSVKSERRNHTFVQWRDIANAQPGSALHIDIVRWADRVRSLGTRVYFTFNHEPRDGPQLQRYRGRLPRRLAQGDHRVPRAGVTNADYLWIMTAYSFKARDRRRAIDWYPGEAYLD
jgi:hypothetical protein